MENKIYIIGLGMGNTDTLTLQALSAIKTAGLVIGAERIVEGIDVEEGTEKAKAILPDQILENIEEYIKRHGADMEGRRISKGNIAVLMSGDVGFYSGSKKLSELLRKRKMDFELIPGISSLQYFSAKIGLSWDEMHVESLHGREADIEEAVSRFKLVFFLLGNDNNPAEVCRRLVELGLGKVKVYIGERLSYVDQRIQTGEAKEFVDEEFNSLSVMVVENPDAACSASKTLSNAVHGLPDESFIRGKVPMTKQEVRTVSISKLAPEREDVVYDIGAGTGSIACEIAMQLSRGEVFAIESESDAFELIVKNMEKFNIKNMKVVSGSAPDALEELPAPDRAFIGGSRGNLRQIVECVIKKNPDVRIVMNAIALETLSEALQIFRDLDIPNVEITEMFVSRTRKVGNYSMMQGLNPVFIISAGGLYG